MQFFRDTPEWGGNAAEIHVHKCAEYQVEASSNQDLAALRHLTGHREPHVGSLAWVKGTGAVKEQVLGEYELLAQATYLCFQGLLEYELEHTISIW